MPLQAQQRLGSVFGDVLRFAQTRMAQVTEENVALGLPDLSAEDQEALVRQSLQETGKTIIESAWAWYGSPSACLSAIVAVEGEEAVRLDRANGLAVIMLLPHQGNWEVANHYLGKHYGLTHMYQESKSATVEQLVQTGRAHTGTQFVAADVNGVRAQLKVLLGGGVIGSMPDQEPLVHQGTFADFFGVSALTSDLVPELASRTSARCYTCVCMRLANAAGFKLVFRDIVLQKAEPLSVSIMNRAIEASVRECPEQYLWSYKRFRTRPPGEEELYRIRDNPMVTVVVMFVMRTLLGLVRHLPFTLKRGLARLLYGVIRTRNGKHVRTARKNIEITSPHNSAPENLLRNSLLHLAENATFLSDHWYSDDAAFNRSIGSVLGTEHLDTESGTIVLTPPLGFREVVMRYLGQNFSPTEYYHPATRTSIDALIREARSAMGIKLVPHSMSGVDRLERELQRGGIITLCPDQQPRLRGGEFVPFFGVPALTTTVITELHRKTGAAIVVAVALRTNNTYDIHFEDWVDRNGEPMLKSISEQLQTTVLSHEDKYRWSDKRFNIQPPGSTRIYR